MPRPFGPLVRHLAALTSRKQPDGLPPRAFALFCVRRQAEAGLLRDGGTTPADVIFYVHELRREAEREIALRRQGHRRQTPAGRLID